MIDTDSRAWPAIYGFPNKEGTGNFEKDPQWWNKTVTGVVNILDADDAGHRRMRRLQNPAFSDKALRAQESVICGYASLLVHKLHGLCSGGGGGVLSGDGGAVVDMTAWYNFTTFGKSTVFSLCSPCGRLFRHGPVKSAFELVHEPPNRRPPRDPRAHPLEHRSPHTKLLPTDIIGDLAFGEPFYCLQNAEWHWWLQAVFDIFKAGTMLRAARRFPEPLATLLCLFIPRKLIQTRKEQFAFGVERVDKRLQQTTDRPDFSESLLLIHPPPPIRGRLEPHSLVTWIYPPFLSADITLQCHTSSTQKAKRA